MSRQEYQSIVVLTGAGISAESGIRTFRASDGLWEDHRVEDVATPAAFIQNPELVHEFYNQRRAHLLSGIEANAAHRALAEYNQIFKGRFTLITQNIDDLHERAGSPKVLHMHGELLKIRCQKSGQLWACDKPTRPEDRCLCCNEPGNLRPHVVWFGEKPLYMDQIEKALSGCDLFVSIGTSGNVYPAAGFFQFAKMNGAHTVELNLEPSANGSLFDEALYGQGSKTVPQYFERLSL